MEVQVHPHILRPHLQLRLSLLPLSLLRCSPPDILGACVKFPRRRVMYTVTSIPFRLKRISIGRRIRIKYLASSPAALDLMFLALALLYQYLLLLASPKRVPQVVRRRSLTPRVKLKTLLDPPLILGRLSLLPDLPRKGEHISNIFLSPKLFHQPLRTHPQRNGPIETS